MNRSLSDFKYKMVDESFTLNAHRQLKTSKASGLEGISPRLLKDAAEVISKPLTQIINASLSQEIVPQEWKQTRITPLLKEERLPVGTIIDPYLSCPWHRNYWSGLFTISCTVSAMKTSYLVLFSVDLEQTTLNEFAVVAFSDYVRHGMDQGLRTGAVFIDLRKALDSVDHDLWINRLESYGFKDTELNWFKSYLTDRKQVVSVGKTPKIKFFSI